MDTHIYLVMRHISDGWMGLGPGTPVIACTTHEDAQAYALKEKKECFTEYHFTVTALPLHKPKRK